MTLCSGRTRRWPPRGQYLTVGGCVVISCLSGASGFLAPTPHDAVRPWGCPRRQTEAICKVNEVGGDDSTGPLDGSTATETGDPKALRTKVPSAMEYEEFEWEHPDNIPLPKAPHAPVIGDKDFPEEELIAGTMEITYGGEPPARRAITDFERNERLRIHRSTAARVQKSFRDAAERARGAEEKAKAKRAAEAKITRGASQFVPEIDLETSIEFEEAPYDEIPGGYAGAKAVAPFPADGRLAKYEWITPRVITFSAEGLLYNYAVPIGLIMRETLGEMHDWVHRLPGPDRFEENYRKMYRKYSRLLPNFGATHAGVSSEDWWYNLFRDAFLATIKEHDLDPELVTDILLDLVDQLYYEILVGPEAWELMPQVAVTLNQLAEWRDNGDGPLLGVVANTDERISTILENLDILPYFDFVINSREVGNAMPETSMFDIALQVANLRNPRQALHVGIEYETDVTASCEAGWESCSVKMRQSDYESPGEPYEYHRIMKIGELLERFGLADLAPRHFSRVRGQFYDDD